MQGKAFSWLFAPLALGVSAVPAEADVSARYEQQRENAPVRIEMMLEIDSGGNMRVQMAQQAGYALILGDVTYMVARGPTGVYVMRMDDVATVMREVASRMGIDRDMPVPPVGDAASPRSMVAMGTRVVNGRMGIAYGTSVDGAAPEFADLVISEDPGLAPIGAALARSFGQSAQIGGRMFPGFAGMMDDFAPLIELLSRGAPLTLFTMNLSDVSTDEIDDSRFALPAEPLTIDQIRQQYQAFETAPTLPPRQN